MQANLDTHVPNTFVTFIRVSGWLAVCEDVV